MSTPIPTNHNLLGRAADEQRHESTLSSMMASSSITPGGGPGEPPMYSNERSDFQKNNRYLQRSSPPPGAKNMPFSKVPPPEPDTFNVPESHLSHDTYHTNTEYHNNNSSSPIRTTNKNIDSDDHYDNDMPSSPGHSSTSSRSIDIPVTASSYGRGRGHMIVAHSASERRIRKEAPSRILATSLPDTSVVAVRRAKRRYQRRDEKKQTDSPTFEGTFDTSDDRGEIFEMDMEDECIEQMDLKRETVEGNEDENLFTIKVSGPLKLLVGHVKTAANVINAWSKVRTAQKTRKMIEIVGTGDTDGDQLRCTCTFEKVPSVGKHRRDEYTMHIQRHQGTLAAFDTLVYNVKMRAQPKL